MKDDRDGGGPESARLSSSAGVDVPGGTASVPSAAWDARRALAGDQALADADQSSADADQSSADADQNASSRDDIAADRDRASADRDQEVADRDQASRRNLTADEASMYERSRGERHVVHVEREKNRLDRSGTAHDRDLTSGDRDRSADSRSEGADARDERAAELAGRADPARPAEALLMEQLRELRAQAGADRARAAADRARAARDRADFARERARLEAELRSAHLDGLTGAYRREMGQLALTHEIDRARRADGRFVIAFVDVDRLKDVNDREGHAAGGQVLRTVVQVLRTRLRSFDPIVRFGGDEFVCGLNGTDLAEAGRRFESIGIAIEAEARVGISVGLAALAENETVEELTQRADAAMLKVKAAHHADRDGQDSRSPGGVTP